MTRSKFVLGSILCVTSFAGGMLVAQGGRHPNLRAAQDLINQAYDRITAAQGANEWDMGGHAARAKELLGAGQRARSGSQPKRPTTTKAQPRPVFARSVEVNFRK